LIHRLKYAASSSSTQLDRRFRQLQVRGIARAAVAPLLDKLIAAGGRPLGQ